MTWLRAEGRFLAILLSLALHGLMLALAGNYPARLLRKADVQPPVAPITFLETSPAPPAQAAPTPPRARLPAATPPATDIRTPAQASATAPSTPHQPAFMEAPPAPTAQEWALAASYTLKNSKRYRYTWGQQVRSMMGTSIEGPDQGVVRFRVEIAPDGTLARLDTLWSTSATAEKLARKAIEAMPRLPPTPTGQPLIFEKTISFQPFDADGPPIYKNDCLPDPPAFRNPFAWDGQSPQQVRAAPPVAEKLDPQALEECLRQLPQDSIEAESAHNRRQLEQWRSERLGR
jgi:hypothetical protein